MRTSNLFGFTVFVMICFANFLPESQAHNIFKKSLETRLGMKIDCNACHIDKKPKTERNAFGGLFYKQFESEELTKHWKSKKGADKKDYETKVMIPAFEKATDKVLAMTVEDMIKVGLIDGIKSKAAFNDPIVVKSIVPSMQRMVSTIPISPKILILANSTASIQPPPAQPAFDFRRLYSLLFDE